MKALKSEIECYGSLFKDSNLKIVDIHMGGGTPSLLNGKDFKVILETLKEYFDVRSKIAIEANPDDLKDKGKTFNMLDSGVDEVSLGVQSFNQLVLRRLGRSHKVIDATQAIQNLRDAGIKYINTDLMYMVPSQTGGPFQSSLEDWRADLEQTVRQPVDEITCYPTLITNYCSGWKLAIERKISQPSMKIFKEMMYIAEDFLSSKGFLPLEIYGYSKHADWKYVTVNYEMEGPLLGLGCGAMGFLGGYKYQNTCFIPDYVEQVMKKQLPIAGLRKIDKVEHAIGYTVCRLFICRSLNLSDFKSIFEIEFGDLIGKSGFGKFLKLLKISGVIKERAGRIELTRKGLFTAQQICWSFVLNVPCRTCEEFMMEPWPSEVIIP